MKRYRSSSSREGGYTLAEILVAISLFVVMSVVTGTLIVQANQVTRKATSSAFTQSQLLDVVSRMSRDVAVADPVTLASPIALEILTVRDANSVRTQYAFVETDAVKHTGEIRSKTSTVPTPGVAPALDMMSAFTVVAENVTLPTMPAGATLLAYVDGNSNPLANGANPLVAGDLPKVARVKINLNASLKDRSKPLTMITSMATRLGQPAGFVGDVLGQLSCPVVSFAWADRTTATLTWVAGYGATSFYIARIPDWPVGDSRLGGVTQAGVTLTDAGLTPGTTYTYTVIPQGPTGQPPCPASASFAPAPAPPVLSINKPAPPLPPDPADLAPYDATLSWPQVAGATGYYLQRDNVTISTYATGAGASYVDRGLTPGVNFTYQVFASNATGDSLASVPVNYIPPPTPIGLAGSAVWQKNTLTWDGIVEATTYRLYRVGTVLPIYTGPALTFADQPRPWASTAQYFVDYVNAAGVATKSNPPLTLDTIAAPLFVPTLSAYPTDYSKTLLQWTTSPGAVRYEVLRSSSAAGAYTFLGAAVSPTYTDTSPALGSTWYYKVVAYSTAAPTPAASSVSNDVLQYPDVPATAGFVARGSGASSGNIADGTDHVAWTPSAGAATYELFVTQGGAAGKVVTTPALGYDRGWVGLGGRNDYWAVGVNTCHNDADDPKRGIDCESSNAPGGPTAPVKVGVYQRPGTPDPWVSNAPTLATNFTRLYVARNADMSNPPAGKFCGVAGLCNYSLERSIDGTAWAATSWTPYFDAASNQDIMDPYTLDTAYANSYWGRTFDWRVRTWNPGGWSDYSANDRTKSYPSPFGFTRADLADGYKFSTTAGLSGAAIYSHDFTWNTSYGTGIAYNYRTWAGGGFSAYAAVLSTPTIKASAGTTNAYTVQAQADNGLTRPIGYTVQTAPATLRNMSARWQCHPLNDTWRIRYDSVDTRPLSGFTANRAGYDLIFTGVGGANNSGTDGAHAGVTWTAFAPNTIQTGWASDPMMNQPGQGAFITVGNEADTRAGVNKAHNYSLKLSLGTTKGVSRQFTGCAGSANGWQYVTPDSGNYPDGSVPRNLTASNP